MDLTETNFKIRNVTGDWIYGDARYLSNSSGMPLVVVLHGFKAWKDWGFFPYVCSRLANHGFITINFSYSLCGVTPGSDTIDLVDDFSENNPLIELEDIRLVINEIRNAEKFADIRKLSNNELILLGHSRGASLAIVAAAEDNSISKIVCLCPIEKYDRFTQRQKEVWRTKGRLEFTDTPSGTKLFISSSYLEAIESNNNRINPVKRIKEIDIPVAIIHAKQDVTVPMIESENIFKYVNNTMSEYRIIEGAGHTFGSSHPFEGTNKKIEEVLEHTINFIRKK
jgi:pimeloyl-ACP methyl ester carboxylesterase